MPNYNRTAYFLDRDAIRNALREEIGIRGVSFVEIGEQTGISPAGLGRFMDDTKGVSLTGDALITVIKWINGQDVNRYIRRRRSVQRHVDTFEQRKLRTGSAYLKSLGVEAEAGETSVDAMMRLIATAKQNGFLG